MASIFLTNDTWYAEPAESTVDLNNNKITNVANPTNATDAVNKQYADSLAGGVNPSQWANFSAINNVNMNSHQINNLIGGTTDNSAVNFGQLQITASDCNQFTLNELQNWADAPAVNNVNMNAKNITNTATINAQNYEISGNGFYKGANNISALPTNAEYPILTAGNGVGMWGKKLTNNDMEALMFKTHYVPGTSNTALSITQYGDVGMGEFTSTDNIRAKLHIINTGIFDCLRVDDQASDTTYFKIDAEGRCGIGTGATTLNQALRVKGDSLLEGVVSCSLGGSSAGWYKGVDVAWYLGGDAKYPLITASTPGGLYVKRTGNTHQVSTQLSTSEDIGGIATSLTRLHIHHTGQVGIGTELPQAKLHIVQTDAQDAFRIDDQASDTTYFKIDENGRCGVNTGSTALTSALTVSGAVDVMNNKITGVATPTNSNDVANKAYVDSVSGGSGWSQYPATQTVNMNYQKISNVANPVDAYDVATRAYVDQQLIPQLPQTREYYVTGTTTIDLVENFNYSDICVTIHCTSNFTLSFTHDTDYNLRGQKLIIFLTYDSSYTHTVTINSPGGGTVALKNGTLSSVMYVCGLRSGANYWRLAYSVL
ncbi:MAG: hypothetical protein EOO92_20320 [Pedobacter sp.]|nr:MAG: hypothetical protein EOO92_20320 [Pedobacter sp.]